MRIIKIFIIGSVVISSTAFSQEKNIWLTYGQSAFLYSPGVEFNFFLNKKVGLQLGFNTYILDYNPKRIVNISGSSLSNISPDHKFNFYNANIGICRNIFSNTNYKLGATLGLKFYYGPDFQPLYYFKEEDYYIYFDSSDLEAEYGIDFGLFYTYKRVTALLKFDNARRKLRFGIGFTFNKFLQL